MLRLPGKIIINPHKPEVPEESSCYGIEDSLFKERKTALNSKVNIFLCLWMTLRSTSCLMRMLSPSLWFLWHVSNSGRYLSVVWQYGHFPATLTWGSLFSPQKSTYSLASSFLAMDFSFFNANISSLSL